MSAPPSSATTPAEPPLNLKLLLIGNSSVGKSSLLLRFTDDDFLSEEETISTIGVDFKVKYIEVASVRYKLSIWDTAGQERFRTLTSSYYRGAQGVVLVYDVSSRSTFEELTRWFNELETHTSPEVVKIIVGNKVDKEFSRQVTTTEGQLFADRMGALFIECSAKTKMGVREVFERLVTQIVATPSLYSRQPKPTASVATSTVMLSSENDTEQGGYLSSCAC